MWAEAWMVIWDQIMWHSVVEAVCKLLRHGVATGALRTAGQAHRRRGVDPMVSVGRWMERVRHPSANLPYTCCQTPNQRL